MSAPPRSSPATRDSLRMAVTMEIWHRFAPENVETWEDEAHQAEYLFCADAILALTGDAYTARDLSPEDAWRELVEKDDRTSPEEYPDMCLISADELRDFMQRIKPTALDPSDAVYYEGYEQARSDLSPDIVGAQTKPVAYRWRQPGAKHWIYDPTPEWIEDHRHEIELEALYASSLSSTENATPSGTGGPGPVAADQHAGANVRGTSLSSPHQK